jgi:hypothetical protein
VSVGQGIANTRPIRWFGWRHKSVCPGGARSVRDAFEDFDAVDVNAANFAEGGFGRDKRGVLRIEITQQNAA